MADTSNSNWVAIAQLLRPQGRRGELLADLLTTLEGQFSAGRLVSLAAPGASAPASDAVPIAIESHFLPVGRNAGRIVLKLASSDSINQAELLAGQQVMIPAAELPTLDPDTFYVGDLLGCRLFDGGHLVGTVIDVQFATTPDGKTRLPDAAPLLCVELATASKQHTPTLEPDAETEPLMIPFVRAYLDQVDIPAKRIVMHLPAGLLQPDAD